VIRDKLKQLEPDARYTVSLRQTATLQPIAGEHLVGPDGNVTLGMYGQVYVAGMTLAEAKTAIDKHLAAFLDQPDTSVAVFAYNSKVYYVIVEDAKRGDMVHRFPITGNETVLDALTQIKDVSSMEKKQISIARPAPGGAGTDVMLNVDWQEITKGAATGNNYQLLPGDRVFVASEEELKPQTVEGWPVPGRNRVFSSKKPPHAEPAKVTPSSSEPRAPDRY
jgi:protein involved in polysaccharide export with SLBB domain